MKDSRIPVSVMSLSEKTMMFRKRVREQDKKTRRLKEENGFPDALVYMRPQVGYDGIGIKGKNDKNSNKEVLEVDLMVFIFGHYIEFPKLLECYIFSKDYR